MLYIALPMVLSFVFLVILTVFITNESIFGLTLRLKAIVEFLPYFLVFLILFYNVKIRKLRLVFFSVILAVCWALVGIFIGLLNGSKVEYVIGDSVRYLIPFVSLGAFIVVFNLYRNSEKRYIDFILKTILTVFFAHIVVKIYFLTNGTVYGGGAHQFIIPPFIFYVLCSLIIRKNIDVHNYSQLNNDFKLWVIISVGLILSFLSLKREYWIVLSFTLFITVFLNLKYKKGFLFSLIFIFVVAAFLILNSWFVEQLASRVDYTFNSDQNIGLDSSSYERLAELISANEQMGKSLGWLEYITGLGAGAEYPAAEGVQLAKLSTGSKIGLYHHIHSMYGIIIFRHGLVGLIIYLLPIVILLRSFLLSDVRKKYYSIYSVIAVGILIDLASGLISAFAANSFYGSLDYGIYCGVLASIIACQDFNNTETAK